MAFDNLDFAIGSDKFSDFYTKYNATMDALKSGASNLVLAANGPTNAPTYQPVWASFVVVGSGGGSPAFSSDFAQSGSATDHIRFRKSILLDTIEITGRFKRINSALVPTFGVPIFILPAGYLPARPVVGVVRHTSNLQLIIDNTTGEVFVVNTGSINVAVNDFMDITIRFPIS